MVRRAIDAYAVYLAVEFVSSALFNLVSVTAVLYYVDDAGLNPLQLVLVGTVLEGVYLLVDLPTGLLADDTVSRRACVVAGFLVLGVGFVVAGLFPVFAVILAAQAVLALGFALVAGALQAWTVGEVGTDRVSTVFLRGSQAGQVGTVAGAALRDSYTPVVDAWVARQAPDTLRASLLSAGQVCDSVGQLTGGPVVGVVGAAVSLRAALAVSAVVLLPALPLLTGLRRRLAAGSDAPTGPPGQSDVDGARAAERIAEVRGRAGSAPARTG